MRRHLAVAKVFEESHHVISLVGTECDAAGCFAPIEHGERRFPFRCPAGNFTPDGIFGNDDLIAGPQLCVRPPAVQRLVSEQNTNDASFRITTILIF